MVAVILTKNAIAEDVVKMLLYAVLGDVLELAVEIIIAIEESKAVGSIQVYSTDLNEPNNALQHDDHVPNVLKVAIKNDKKVEVFVVSLAVERHVVN